MKNFKNMVKAVFTFSIGLAIIVNLQSCKDDEDPRLAQPTFTVVESSNVMVGEAVDIDVSSISAPGKIQTVSAKVVAGGGTVTVSSQPTAGSTSGAAVIKYTADNNEGAATIEITITDQQNPSSSTSKSTQVSKSTTPPPTTESIVGITGEASDLFDVDLGTKNGQKAVILKGTINRDITIKVPEDGYEWVFAGNIMVVPNGSTPTTITINKGVTIYFDAEAAATSFLAIQRGAKIMADGEDATGLITLTSSNELGSASVEADGGDWGGLVLNGYGNINPCDDADCQAEGEGGTGVYGGTNDDDNSGTLRYVLLKYAGRIIGVDNELNGFSFNGVGSGTVLEYLQSYYGEDDGFEFFGGTANLKYAVSTGSKDDSFDWTHGWRGNAQFLLVEQIADRGDRGFEGDNLEGNYEAEPYSTPTISNVTLIGSNGNEDQTTGMRLRHGTKGKIHNALVTGFAAYGIRADDDATTGANVTDESLIVTNSIVFKSDAGNFTKGSFGKAGSVWETTNDNSTDGSSITLNDGVGVSTTGAVDPTSAYGTSWFTSVSQIGAVDPSNNWLAGWALKKDGTTTY